MNPIDWLSAEIAGVTDELVMMRPSEWAEAHRRLPESAPMPGAYDYNVVPYMREIVDCMDVRSPVRQVAIMKGAQLGATTGGFENWLGYVIGHVASAPTMLVTATQELAQLRIDEYIMPMIEQSNLKDRIQSHSETNKRKSGATAGKISWRGGGMLLAVGSREASRLRSMSIRNLCLDEFDAFPASVGRDGDPAALAEARTYAYEKSRKILMLSTPTLEETSNIWVQYQRGDQSVWEVPCLGCGVYQELRWQHKDRDGKQIGGIVFETEGGVLVPGSVHYVCPHCGECHVNEHKRRMLPRGRWRPTAKPETPAIRSFLLSGLNSPPDFLSWDNSVVRWLRAWNVETNQPRSLEKLQEFYNNILGKPYRASGERLTLVKVARHARDYVSGTVPAALARGLCDGPISFVTAAVDVQADFLAVSVYAWGPGRVGFMIGRYKLEGDTSDPFDSAGPWGECDALLDHKYPDGEGREYPIAAMVIDSGFATAEVYAFANKHEGRGVFPIKGDVTIRRGAAREFHPMKDASRTGVKGFVVNVNHYKHRLAAVLKVAPGDSDKQAMTDSVCFPSDLTEDALRELLGEQFIQHKGVWKWQRMRARNELWDTTVYNCAARDIVGFLVCREHFHLPVVNWSEFWPWAEANRFGWAESTPVAP